MPIALNDDGLPNTITYFTTSTAGGTLAELPLVNTTWSYAVNAAGQFSGELNVEDPRVANLNWIQATAPNLAEMWVDINGTLVWGGMVKKRTYNYSTGKVTITGSDFYQYVSQRLQAKDYATTWVTSAAGAAQIAYTIITDALAAANSLSVAVASPAATPAAYQVTLSAPLSQRMSVDSLVTQLSSMGWLVGFDFSQDVSYVGGVPTATLTLSYPRRGRIAGTTGTTIDIVPGVEFRYDEDGGQQANWIVELATAAGGVPLSQVWTPSMTVDGYPLLEKATSHASFSPSASPATVLQAYAAADLALFAYPPATSQITVPLFADPPIGSWIVGDDFRVMIPNTAGESPACPRFPTGLDMYLRSVRADVKVPEQGVPTVTHTMILPPSSTPQRPPQ